MGSISSPTPSSRFAGFVDPDWGRLPPRIWSRHRPPRWEIVSRVRVRPVRFGCERRRFRRRYGRMAVREQRSKPLVHDLKVVIVPFLRVFVDPWVQKKGAIKVSKKMTIWYWTRRDLSELTCACCGATLSNVVHISASLVSLLHNSRRNALTLQEKRPVVSAGTGKVGAIKKQGVPRVPIPAWEGSLRFAF